MNLLRCVLFLLSTSVLALGQLAHQSQQAIGLHSEPEAMVRSFYQQVVARHPGGLPKPADMKILAPFLSKTLLHRIDIARSCEHDWYRQHRDPNVKPEMAWLEAGLFSGQDERTGPNAFAIERIESEMDGSSHVYVRLKWWETSDNSPDIRYATPNRPVIWQVAAIVVREKGHYVVDDVIYLKDKDYKTESRLSELLAKGCEGPRWVGYRDAK